MAMLRYALNDGVNAVTVQNSWTEETYYRPIPVVDGVVETDDELEIFALCQRGFVIVDEGLPREAEPVQDAPSEEPVQAQPEDEPLEKALRKMTRAQLNKNAGRYGLTEDAESFDNRDELIAAILAVNEED